MQPPRILWMEVFFLAAAMSSHAADPPKRPSAVISPDEADDDFAFQGEYLGSAWDAVCCRWRTFGLQIVAQGDEQFIAAGYWGGLPGYGWRGGERLAFIGKRAESLLSLHGERFAVSVRQTNGHVAAVLADPGTSTGNGGGNDACWGRLRKVERHSSTLGARPPRGAVVLFDGTNTEGFQNARMTADGLLEVGADFADAYGDYFLHLEFRLPYMPRARGQGRGNSGVYLQSRYEVQILDSFGLEGKDNECGGLYKYLAPRINMCLPPLAWQTYDIHFRSPRFDSAGNKICPARLTVCHNGVVIHHNVAVERKTGAGREESPELFPIKLQNHGNPVHFRNIWLVDYGKP